MRRRLDPARVVALTVLVLVALLACKRFTGGGSSSEGSGTSGGESVGVPECDEFITKYEKCVKDNVPAVARPGMEKSVENMRKSWKAAAATPQGKAGLAEGCRQALAQTKTAMAAYHCEW